MMITEQDYKILLHTSLFKNITKEDCQKLIQELDGYTKTYTKQEIILQYGSPIHMMGIVLHGSVEGSFLNEEYNKIAMNHFHEGQSFLESFAILHLPHSPLTLHALSECTILFLDIQKVMHMEFTHPYQTQCNQNLMRKLATQNVFTNLKLRIANQQTLRNKVRLYLLSLTPDQYGYVHIPFTITALAEFLGVNRSALSRELSKMKKEGIIIENHHTFKLMD